jgi:hypothetical protein
MSEAARTQGNDVEPVAPDLGRRLRGHVTVGELEAGNVGDPAREEAALEGQRGGSLAGVMAGVVDGYGGPGDQVMGERQVGRGERPRTLEAVEDDDAHDRAPQFGAEDDDAQRGLRQPHLYHRLQGHRLHVPFPPRRRA